MFCFLTIGAALKGNSMEWILFKICFLSVPENNSVLATPLIKLGWGGYLTLFSNFENM